MLITKDITVIVIKNPFNPRYLLIIFLIFLTSSTRPHCDSHATEQKLVKDDINLIKLGIGGLNFIH